MKLFHILMIEKFLEACFILREYVQKYLTKSFLHQQLFNQKLFYKPHFIIYCPINLESKIWSLPDVHEEQLPWELFIVKFICTK